MVNTLKLRALAVNNLGGVFAMDPADFGVIKKRVEESLRAEGIADRISKKLPAFKGALEAAKKWDTKMFPQMKVLAGTLSAYSRKLAIRLSELDKKVQALQSVELSPELQQEIARMITDMSSSIRPIYQDLSTIALDLNGFIVANRALDEDIMRYDLAFIMKAISNNLNAIEKANGLVRGEWGRLVQDLEIYSSLQPEDFTITIVADLGLQNAVEGWNKLAAECDDFLRRW